jgi:protein-S-isoprenylcysteine O-methyltransferase Ste14
MHEPRMSSPARFYYALRGWMLAGIFVGLAWIRFDSDRELRLEGLILVAMGAAYRFYAARFIAGHSNGDRLTAGPLAVGGPYAIGRHPLYLSNLITALGLAWFANCLTPLWTAAFLSAVFLHHLILAKSEERFLSAGLGEVYGEYVRRTPRWAGLPTGAFSSPGKLTEYGKVGVTAGVAWSRQSGNLIKTLACVVVLWALS